MFRLNRKTWKLYVPFHKQQQLQEQSACCIGVQALLNALGINFEVKESGKPVFFDVTHSLQQPGMLEKSTGGRGQYVFDLAKAGVSQNIAGLFIETHPDPANAMCDGPCALKLSELESFLMEIFELDSLIKRNR